MNWESLYNRLIRAARQHPPGDQVPDAFEKRVLAGLLALAEPIAPTAPIVLVTDDWATVSRAFGWAAGVCSAVALAMSVWSYVPDSAAGSFADELEQTILVSASPDDGGTEVDFDLLR